MPTAPVAYENPADNFDKRVRNLLRELGADDPDADMRIMSTYISRARAARIDPQVVASTVFVSLHGGSRGVDLVDLNAQEERQSRPGYYAVFPSGKIAGGPYANRYEAEPEAKRVNGYVQFEASEAAEDITHFRVEARPIPGKRGIYMVKQAPGDRMVVLGPDGRHVAVASNWREVDQAIALADCMGSRESHAAGECTCSPGTKREEERPVVVEHKRTEKVTIAALESFKRVLRWHMDPKKDQTYYAEAGHLGRFVLSRKSPDRRNNVLPWHLSLNGQPLNHKKWIGFDTKSDAQSHAAKYAKSPVAIPGAALEPGDDYRDSNVQLLVIEWVGASGLAPVERVVCQAMSSMGMTKHEVWASLRRLAQAQKIELRPEAGRVSAAMREFCPPGPHGSVLSWARPLEAVTEASEPPPKRAGDCIAIVERVPACSKVGPPAEAAKDVFKLMSPIFKRLGHEAFFVVLVNVQGDSIGSPIQVASGQRARVAVDVEQILAPVIKGVEAGCNSFWITHGHPSGRPHASGADKELTKSVREAAKIACPATEFKGHVVVGDGEFKLA